MQKTNDIYDTCKKYRHFVNFVCLEREKMEIL